MTAAARPSHRARPRHGESPGRAERALLIRVVDALYREDHLGWSSASRPSAPPARVPAQSWVPAVGWRVAPLPGGRQVLAPMCPDGFLADHRLAAPLLVVEGAGPTTGIRTRLTEVLDALTPLGDPAAMAGWTAFADECRQALAVARLPVPAVVAPTGGSGYPGLLRYEAIAAAAEHPVHPFARCRLGLTTTDLRRYGPEFSPRFRLRWSAVPRRGLAMSGSVPSWWPVPSTLGMSADLDDDHVALPVHPLTAARGLVTVTGRAWLPVTPTLSTRTVAVVGDPTVQLKMPLPTATLGARNRRTIKAGTLGDGDVVQRLLAAVLAREPALTGRVLLADESTWLHSGDEHLAVLVRRMPPEVDGCTLVPVAALAATPPGDPDAGPVLCDLGARYPGGRHALLGDYLDLLFDWHVALWLRYGIALESHGQNVTVVLDTGPDPAPRGGPRLRLLYKDNDGPRVDCRRLAEALGNTTGAAVGPGLFADARIAVSDDRELADVFTTITLHLCAAAPVLALATGPADRRHLTEMVSARLEAAADRWCDGIDARGRRAERLLRREVLGATRLPIKAMVTAGTLLPKERLGCTDINKYYLRTGPNYLRAPRSRATG